jgi:hypothetical protein
MKAVKNSMKVAEQEIDVMNGNIVILMMIIDEIMMPKQQK